jgi:Uma2 family endonuclease
LPGNSRPEPDVTLLRWRDDYYSGKSPTLEDVLLVIEVAETSIKYDSETKGRLYAEAGIPEYWLLNLWGGGVEVYADPIEGTYQTTKKAKRGDTLSLPYALGHIEVSNIFGRTSGSRRDSTWTRFQNQS